MLSTTSAAPAPHFVVIGGGVAGVSCAEELCRVAPTSSITLISSSTSARGIANYVKVTDALESFDVEEVSLSSLQSRHPNLQCRSGVVIAVDPSKRCILLLDGSVVKYDRLCVCTGAVPRTLLRHPLVLSIRDTQVREPVSITSRHVHAYVLLPLIWISDRE